jgi:hypothetical protein
MTKVIDLSKKLGKGNKLILKSEYDNGIKEYLIHFIFPENKFGVKILGYQKDNQLIITNLETNNPKNRIEKIATIKAIINMSPIFFTELKKHNISEIRGLTNNSIANLVRKRFGAEIKKMKKTSALREAIIRKKISQGKKKATTKVRIRI